MKKRVYIETTVVSYLVSRPSRDIIMVAHQEVTREWWESRRRIFDVYISQVVVTEAGRGDAEAAERRLEAIAGLTVLDFSPDVAALAEDILRDGLLPESAADDALHIAFAAVHRMDFLLTWNCKHLANGQLLEPLATALLRHGYHTPIICTPEELMEDRDD